MNANSSIDSLSTCKDKIISILSKWETMHKSFGFDFFVGLTENLKTHLGKIIAEFIEEASERVKNGHTSTVSTIKIERNERAPDEAQSIESPFNDSIGKCIKDIRSILSQWEAMHASSAFELFRGMAETLNKHFGKIIDDFIDGASERAKTEKKLTVFSATSVKNDHAPDEVVIIDSDDETEMNARPGVETDLKNDAIVINHSSKRSIVDINPKKVAIKSGLKHLRSNGINSSVACQSSSSESRIKKRSKCQCEVCCKILLSITKLIFHRRIHLNEFPVYCRICLYSFGTETARDVHEMICEQKRYECHLCKRILQDSYALREHMRRHSGRRPFKCNICNARFAGRSNKVKHLVAKHKN